LKEGKSKNKFKPETIEEMKKKVERNYFPKKVIMEKFKHYKKPGQMKISDSEYEAFYDAISILHKSIVERIEREIYFISVSRDGFYINFQSEDLKNKKGIIYISPHILEFDDRKFRCRSIHHEIAHHILGHKDVKSSEELKKKDDAAYELADEWWQKYYGKYN